MISGVLLNNNLLEMLLGSGFSVGFLIQQTALGLPAGGAVHAGSRGAGSGSGEKEMH